MYFNRHNAQPKNWRMYKKGKTFLYGCSLVLATGIALSAPSLSVSAESPQAADQGATVQPDQDPLAAQPVPQPSEPTATQAPSQPVPAPQPAAVEAKAPHLDPIAKTGLVWSGSLTPEDFLANSADLKAQGASISFATGTPSPDATSVSLTVTYPDGTKTLIQVPLTQMVQPAEAASSPAPESPAAEALESEVKTEPDRKRVRREADPAPIPVSRETIEAMGIDYYDTGITDHLNVTEYGERYEQRQRGGVLLTSEFLSKYGDASHFFISRTNREKEGKDNFEPRLYEMYS